MKRTVMIEGFPVCWSDGDAPSWYEGRTINGLSAMPERPAYGQTIDPMGGIADINPMKFVLTDLGADYFTDSERSLADWCAKNFQFYDSNFIGLEDDPILYNDAFGLAVDSTDHPTAKKLQPATGNVYIDHGNRSDLAFTGDFTVGMYVYLTSYNSAADFFMLKYNTSPQSGWGMYSVAGNLRGLLRNGAVVSVLSSTLTVPLNALTFIAMRYTYATDTVKWWVDAVTDTAVATNKPGANTDQPFIQWGYSASAVDRVPRGYLFKSWAFGAALSDADVQNLRYGRPIDADSQAALVLETNGSPYSSSILYDLSGNDYHGNIPSGSTWSTRQLIPGDPLYLPRDTARVYDVDTSGSTIDLERQVYSCLEDETKAYYRQSVGADYTLRAHTGGPREYTGRLVTYYEDDALKYVGILKGFTQDGKRWSIDTESALKPLREGFKPQNISLTLYAPNSGGWWVGDTGFSAQVSGSDTILPLLNSGTFYNYGALPGWLDQFASIPDTDYTFANITGYLYIGSTKPEFADSPSAQGIKDAFFPQGTFISYSGGGWSSSPDGVKRYGLLFSDGMEVRVAYDYPWALEKNYLRAVSSSGSEYYVYVSNVATDGTLTLKGPYDKDFNYMSEQRFGIASNHPISIEMAPVVGSLLVAPLVYALLTSTGAGLNGEYDDIDGFLGLGLPSELVDTSIRYLEDNWVVTADLSSAKIGEELKAQGYALVFDYALEKFRIRRIRPPVAALATASISDDDLERGQRVGVSWGYQQPLSSMSYKAKNCELRAAVQSSNLFGQSTFRSLDIETQTSAVIENQDAFFRLMIKRVTWLANYAPTVILSLPFNALQVGDVVSVTIAQIAGEGRYGVAGVPGIVTKVEKGAGVWGVHVMLNTNPTARSAAWVPSWEIESYSGAALTMLHSEDLDELSNWIGDSLQIVSHDGAVLDSPVVISSISGSVVTLTGAPTYTQTLNAGILTLPDYTSALSADVDRFAWAASAGVMSNADDGKVLY